ncbi:hypothetical protein DA391_14675 [Yersinia massiliensis]|uniref:Uncharacterized protein n=1 Tax=Yersinia massiliensis TaxID=419257 RepID=A0ABM6UUU6_9GAMM|nr:hypothetical protein DA391_14675 [Yersinia massiliensis]
MPLRNTAKLATKETSSLHRTRLHTLRYKVFSVLFFYKPTRQPAPWLGLCSISPTEKNEKNFRDLDHVVL